MKRTASPTLTWLVCLGASLATFAACSGGSKPSGFGGGDGGGIPGAAGGNPGDADGGDPLGGDPFGGGAGAAAGCVNLECRQVKCQGAARTSVSGKVLDPSGKLPLYNVIVYVPNAAPQAFADEISCDKCGAVTGKPLVTAITGPDGSFTLNDVPEGDNVPLVIQIGKWRRQLVLPRVEQCVDNPVADAGNLRMPRTSSEGDMPRIAIATGSIDPFECLLRKIGIADSEFTPANGTGRIHIYQENGMGIGAAGDAQRAASELYGDPARLKKYDVVILPCGANDLNKDTADKQRMIDYTANGGRVFATHYGYDWLRDAPAPWPATARYRATEASFSGTPTGIIDTSFPKGQDFAKWLVLATKAVDAASNPVEGRFAINEARLNVDGVAGDTRQWVTTTTPASVQHLTFNTPVGKPVDEQCGRVVYSNFHVTSGITSRTDRFPAKCSALTGANNLTPQELALVFMLFDLSSCIQADGERPKPPPVR